MPTAVPKAASTNVSDYVIATLGSHSALQILKGARDDMIDTAGSTIAAKDALVKHGANKDIYVAATHAILSGLAVKRLSDAGFKEIVVTDSIPTEGKNIPGLTILSIAPMLAEVIEHVVEGKSVTEMYE